MTVTINYQHSGRTIVNPVFEGLRQNGGPHWTTELLRLADGIELSESMEEVIPLWDIFEH